MDSKFDHERDINLKEKIYFLKIKLNMLAVHEQLSKSDLNNTQMEFDATLLYPFAMREKNSVFPKEETGIAFKPHMNDVYVEAFNIQTFNQNGDESAILK